MIITWKVEGILKLHSKVFEKFDLKNISSDAKLYYIKGKNNARQIKKYPRPAKLSIHRTRINIRFP
jgi:hypothetical protein